LTVYEKILLAVDASDQSDHAVRAAKELAQLSGGVVHLFHVQERQVVIGKSGGAFDVEASDEAAAVVDRARQTLEEAGVKVQADVIHSELGHVAQEIVAAAHKVDADMIVMGSHGRTGLGAMLLGSNAYKTLHLTDRPVLVVR